MVLVFHHVIIFFLLSDWLIQILPPFWFCCDVACFCFGSETQLKCTYRRCCQFFKNIVLCLDVLSGGESASMATFFFMTLLLFSRMLTSTTVFINKILVTSHYRSIHHSGDMKRFPAIFLKFLCTLLPWLAELSA